MTCKRTLIVFVPVLAAWAALVAAAGEAESTASLPVNKWTKLPCKPEQGYKNSALIYVPSRKQVLHWGAAGGGNRGRMRDDVRAFSPSAKDWISDYPSSTTGLPREVVGAGGGDPRCVTFTGSAVMLPTGKPSPSQIVNGVCYDSKRDRLVYTIAGLTAAYDIKSKTWTDLKAKDIPAVYGVGVGYDPVNDEIVMFPHFGGQNTDRLDVDGQISCHYGTLRYSFADNTWRRVSDTFGSDDVRKARSAVLTLMGKVSRASDAAWALRKRPDAAKTDEVKSAFADAAAEAANLALPAAAGEAFKKAGDHLTAASKEAAAGRWSETVAAAGAALWALDEDVLGGALRVEPPPRFTASLAFDPRNKALVMFGGKTGIYAPGVDATALNDTWIYDCQTRQWRELPCPTRPPVTTRDQHADESDLVYDPASGLFLFVLRPRQWVNSEKNVVIWGLDVAKAEWRKLHEQPWTWERTAWYSVALDEANRLLLLVQQEAGDLQQATYGLRLDASALAPAAAPAPAWTAPRIEPTAIPPDDPAWVAKLKTLPANQWVHTKPPSETVERGYTSMAYDPVRGWVVFFGGGHSSYQVSRVDIYSVGANRWVTTVGEHNDRMPGVGWEGDGIGLRGSPRAGHERNTYVAVDGRMYIEVPCGFSNTGISPELRARFGKYAWFCDLDRGGVWRMIMPSGGVEVDYRMAAADGRVIGFGSGLPSRRIGPSGGNSGDGRVIGFGSRYDIYANEATAVKAADNPGAVPVAPGESRPFCFLPDKGEKGQVFYFDSRNTWIYDLKTEAWKDLQARSVRAPGPKGGEWTKPNTVEYIEGQDWIWAQIQTDYEKFTYWAYSFKHNAWIELPLNSDGKLGVGRPYGQVVYAAKYGVLVSAPDGTAVMRPDFSQIKWE